MTELDPVFSEVAECVDHQCTFQCFEEVVDLCASYSGHCNRSGWFWSCFSGPDPGPPYPGDNGPLSDCLPSETSTSCNVVCASYGLSCADVLFMTDCYGVGSQPDLIPGFERCEVNLHSFPEAEAGRARCQCGKAL